MRYGTTREFVLAPKWQCVCTHRNSTPLVWGVLGHARSCWPRELSFDHVLAKASRSPVVGYAVLTFILLISQLLSSLCIRSEQGEICNLLWRISHVSTIIMVSEHCISHGLFLLFPPGKGLGRGFSFRSSGSLGSLYQGQVWGWAADINVVKMNTKRGTLKNTCLFIIVFIKIKFCMYCMRYSCRWRLSWMVVRSWFYALLCGIPTNGHGNTCKNIW